MCINLSFYQNLKRRSFPSKLTLDIKHPAPNLNPTNNDGMTEMQIYLRQTWPVHPKRSIPGNKKMLSCVSKSNQFSVTSHYMFKWIMTKYTSVFSVHYISKTGQMYCKWPRTLTLYLQDLILAVVQRSVSLKHFISLTGLILQITFQNRPQECFVHEQASIQMHNTWVCVSLCEL